MLDLERHKSIFMFVALKKKKKKRVQGVPCDSVVKNSPANAGDMELIPDLRRFHMPQSN